MQNPFVHLRVHSDYSLGRGASKVKALVKRAAGLEQPALALTDDMNLHGAMQMAKACKEAGVQPIMGATVQIQARKLRGSVVMLAQTAEGYARICRIVNMGLRPGRQVQGALDAADLKALHEEHAAGSAPTGDVILLAGSGGDGFLGRLAAEDDGGRPRGSAGVTQMLRYLGPLFHGRLYVEICRNGFPDESETSAERAVLEAAVELGLPIVATSDTWYATEAEHDAFEILKAVEAGEAGGVTAEDGRFVHVSPRRFMLRSADDMRALFADLPEALEQAPAIARRCAFAAHARDPILPPFDTGRGLTETEEMREQAADGLRQRLATNPLAAGRTEKDYWDRLEFELGVIERMKFPGYFLIVSDFIKWAKSQDIPVGPGRGSGAGSLVAWSLFITDLDPLRFNLLFERFLNPDRISMPDFDIDFCEDRRPEVVDYVRRKYGDDKVAQIVTFTGLKSKGALSDAGRVVRHATDGSLSFREIKAISSLIPKDKDKPADPAKLSVAYETSAEFRARIDEAPRARAVYDAANRIEGLYRNASSHAAGVIIGGQPLTDLVPVGFDGKTGSPLVQFYMKDAEDAGLVKFDFLGLTTLSVIKETIGNIRQTTGEDLDIMQVPLDDKPTFDMLSDGYGTAVFQLESEGMKRVLRTLKPERFEDVIALVSLYRPGPMDLIPEYVACRHGKQPTFPEPCDRTEPVLGETFGIMVYQEQVMQVAQRVAGFSLGEADLLRRAMGKKDAALLASMKQKFVDGAVATGVVAKHAQSLFDLIEKFASYGFNKSHAAAYALLAYQTAWLKKHHPVEFFAAFLSYQDNPEKMALVKQDMDQFGIELLPPCVNASYGRFKPERGPDGKLAVRFGLRAVSGISDGADAMARERDGKGPHPDLETFHARAGKLFNSAQFANLARSGAFDAISPNGNRKLASDVLAFLSKNSKSGGGDDLFGGAAKVMIPKDILATSDWPIRDDEEYQAIGFYVRQHPLDRNVEEVKRRGVRRRASIVEHLAKRRIAQADNKRVMGLVEKVDVQQTRRGDNYLRVMLAEKEDRYWVSYYIPYETTLETCRQELETAKKNREPVVFMVRFGQSTKADPNEAVYYLDSKKFWPVQKYIQEYALPGIARISMDPRSPSVPRSMRAMSEEIAGIDASLAQGLDPELQVRSVGLQMDVVRGMMEYIVPMIEQGAPVDDASGYEVHFEVTVTGKGIPPTTYRLPSALSRRYRFPIELKRALNGSFGVTSVDLKEDDTAVAA